MKSTLTIRLDDELEALINKLALQAGQTRSDLVRQALKKQLTIQAFHKVRDKILPFAEAQGLLTDEDAFREIS